MSDVLLKMRFNQNDLKAGEEIIKQQNFKLAINPLPSTKKEMNVDAKSQKDFNCKPILHTEQDINT